MEVGGRIEEGGGRRGGRREEGQGRREDSRDEEEHLIKKKIL